MIANKDNAIVKGKEDQIPAAALINLLIKIASRDETTIMAIGCDEDSETMRVLNNIQDMLKGVLRLIKIVKFEIDKIFREYLSAIKETGRAL